MATLLDDSFEGSIPPAWFDTTQGGGMEHEDGIPAVMGTHCARYDCTGAARWNQHTALNKRQLVGRMYLRVGSAVSGTASILSIANASGNHQLMLRPGPALRAEIGATFASNSSALTIDTWYRIDWRLDSSTATGSTEYQIDGTAQPTASRAQAAADMTSLRLGNTGTNTYLAYVDVLTITDDAADYPLGDPMEPVGGIAPVGMALALAPAGRASRV